MTNSTCLYVGALLCLLFAGCRGSQDDAALADGPTHQVKFTEDLSVGREESGGVLFSVPWEVRTDPDGNFYVADNRFATVSAFAPDGQFRFSVSGQGDAPEQVRNFQTFHVAGDSIMVFGYRNEIVTFDRETGDFIRRQTPDIDTERYAAPGYPGVSDAGLVAALPVLPSATNPEASPWDIATRNELRVFDGDSYGEVVWEGSRQEWLRYSPTGPNAPSTSTPAPQGHDAFCAVDGDVMYCAENDSLEFDVVRLADGVTTRFSMPYEPLEATDADQAAWAGRLGRDQNFLAVFQPPSNWRALEGLLIDDARRLWMQVRVTRADSIVTWWVADPQSDYRASVSLPDSVELLAVSGGKAYARVWAESGEVWVSRYAVE